VPKFTEKPWKIPESKSLASYGEIQRERGVSVLSFKKKTKKISKKKDKKIITDRSGGASVTSGLERPFIVGGGETLAKNYFGAKVYQKIFEGNRKSTEEEGDLRNSGEKTSDRDGVKKNEDVPLSKRKTSPRKRSRGRQEGTLEKGGETPAVPRFQKKKPAAQEKQTTPLAEENVSVNLVKDSRLIRRGIRKWTPFAWGKHSGMSVGQGEVQKINWRGDPWSGGGGGRRQDTP